MNFRSNERELVAAARSSTPQLRRPLSVLAAQLRSGLSAPPPPKTRCPEEQQPLPKTRCPEEQQQVLGTTINTAFTGASGTLGRKIAWSPHDCRRMSFS